MIDAKNLADVEKELGKDKNIALWLEKSAIAINYNIVNSLHKKIAIGYQYCLLYVVDDG